MDAKPPIKQVIVIRKDLGMRRGKEIAQGSHASQAWLTGRVTTLLQAHRPLNELWLDAVEREWLLSSFRKVVVRVESEEELLDIHEKARKSGLVSELIQDAGLTEFGGKSTYTALAIGPDRDDKIDAVTGHLTLY